MATADTTPPVLTSLNLPATINLTSGSAVATFKAGATDVGSGIDYVVVLLDHAFQTTSGVQNGLYFFDSASSFAGGASTLSQTFTAATAAGVYGITLLAVYDKAGNTTIHTPAQLQTAHLATSFTVTGPSVVGGAGADTLSAHAGDTVYGGAGNDVITGVSGVTTSLYSGALSEYRITQSGSTVTIADNLVSRDGTDTLNNVSQARFSNVTLVFDLHSAQDLLVYKLYQAAYGRTPDNGGFRYWAGVADANHTSDVALADSFLAAAEFTQLYGVNPSLTDYVTGLYSHVLGRAPDAGGLAYWVGAGLPRDALLAAFAASGENAQLIGSHIANGYWTT